MNDFTKEELKELLHYLEVYYPFHTNTPLMIKLDNMIDNYCEHHPEIAYFDNPEPAYKCSKCGVFLNEKNF